MNFEERDKHEKGIATLNASTGSAFSYELLEDARKLLELFEGQPRDVHKYLNAFTNLPLCGCGSRAQFVEKMKRDSSYVRYVCIQCRDKQVQHRYKNWLKRRIPDQNRYVITSQQAREVARARRRTI